MLSIDLDMSKFFRVHNERIRSAEDPVSLIKDSHPEVWQKHLALREREEKGEDCSEEREELDQVIMGALILTAKAHYEAMQLERLKESEGEDDG